MSEKNLASYVRLINQFKPNFIHGYPSAIITLAQFMRRKKLHFEFKLKGIIGISENILEAQRSYITSTFQTRFFSFYGHSEKLVLAGECEKNNFYHIEPLYGFAEIIDFNGKPVMHAGQKGELVGTGFINHAMPFIRYRTGDLVELSGEKCECGREYILLKKIEGRWLQEMLVTKERFLVSITALNMHSSIFDNVAKFQFEQDEPGKAVLNIIKSNSFSENDGKLILTELERKLDNQIDLELAFVDEINPNISGKSLFLKQNIDIRKFWPQFD